MATNTPFYHELQQLQFKYNLLSLQLQNESVARKSAELDLTIANTKIQSLTETISQRNEEVNYLSMDLEAERGYTKDLQQRYKAVTKDNEAYKDSLDYLETSFKGAQQTQDALKTELIAMTQQRDSLLTKIQASESQQKNHAHQAVRQLTEEVSMLKADSARKQCLTEVVMDVRMRYLKQAKDLIAGATNRWIQADFVEAGNQAAHSGHGVADATILKMIKMPETQLHEYEELYFKLYGLSPELFVECSPQLREALNHEATLRTLRAKNTSLARPLSERLRVIENVQVIWDRCRRLNDEEVAVAADLEIERRLQLVRDDIAKIVEIDRLSRNHNFKPSRNTDTAY